MKMKTILNFTQNKNWRNKIKLKYSNCSCCYQNEFYEEEEEKISNSKSNRIGEKKMTYFGINSFISLIIIIIPNKKVFKKMIQSCYVICCHNNLNEISSSFLKNSTSIRPRYELSKMKNEHFNFFYWKEIMNFFLLLLLGTHKLNSYWNNMAIGIFKSVNVKK